MIIFISYAIGMGWRKRSDRQWDSRKSDFMHHHHHHPEGMVYRNLCLNSSTLAVSEIASRRWWCIESVFPDRKSGREGTPVGIYISGPGRFHDGSQSSRS